MQTLHIVDRLLWMAPFVTMGDMNEACRRADVSHEERNEFLTKLLEEHIAPGSREQLKALKLQWVKQHYPSANEESCGSAKKMAYQAETPRVRRR